VKYKVFAFGVIKAYSASVPARIHVTVVVVQVFILGMELSSTYFFVAGLQSYCGVYVVE